MPRQRHSAAGELNRTLDIGLSNGDLGMALAAARRVPVVGFDRAVRILLLMTTEVVALQMGGRQTAQLFRIGDARGYVDTAG